MTLMMRVFLSSSPLAIHSSYLQSYSQNVNPPHPLHLPQRVVSFARYDHAHETFGARHWRVVDGKGEDDGALYLFQLRPLDPIAKAIPANHRHLTPLIITR